MKLSTHTQRIKQQPHLRLAAYAALAVMIVAVGYFGYQMLTFGKGNVYVLQQQDGNINLVRTKLDGSESKVVVPGSGKETLNGETATVILASRDWNYVAMRTLRDNGNPKVYIYDGRTDKLKQITVDDARYEFVGWLDGRFIYVAERNEANRSLTSTLKSYDPASDQTIDIQSVGGRGLGAAYIIGDRLSYTAYPEEGSAIYSVNADGSDSKKLQEFKNADGDGGIFTNNIYEPRSLFFSFYQSQQDTKHFKYSNGTLTSTDDKQANQQKFRFYIASPSGKRTAWYETKDGKNQIYIGNADGQKGKVKATLPADHKPYAWYGEKTLLIAKGETKKFGPPAPKTLYTLNPWTGNLKQITSFIPSNKPFNIAMAGYPGASYGYAGIFDY